MAGRSTPSVRPVHFVAAASIVVILISTLSPFDFGFAAGPVAAGFTQGIRQLGDASDWILNILLFAPLGLALTVVIGQRQTNGGWRVLIAVLAICAALSAMIEVLQLFLPARQSSIGDLLSNSLGVGLGYLVARVVGPTVLLMPLSRFSTRALCLAAAAYLILVMLTVAFLQQQTMLGDWEPSYPLLLGNERTGDRSWLGHVLEVSMADQAIGPADVARTFTSKSLFPAVAAGTVASYDLSRPGSHRDRAGRLPELRWHGRSSYDEHLGARLTPTGWLETNGSAAAITERIARTSAFTLNAVVATNRVDQTGPARIVSLSKDTYHRNLTLGQEGTDLILRIRTRLTGVNGSRGEIAVPNIFKDTAIHQIIVVYKRPSIKIFVDDAEHQYSLDLSPELTLFGSLLSFNPQFRIGGIAAFVYAALFYGAVFLPLGYLLALIVMKQPASASVCLPIVCAGLILPAVAVEISLSVGGNRAVSFQDLALSAAVTAVPLVAVYLRSRHRGDGAARR